ncbi:MAG: ribbon-helix-helix domain-containing protein [Candidatus Thermoplasmatota archaeon]|nr:ribbon-helix-helix protein, CopG family [Euryarchaeota archaeon]MBU4031639.1 ribbon-helix-helix domain-containing protein [Candidatus Thermoplasmatota archaeon]MBU4071705.1 ribbon-helix-helix domain-containing protein [Candidatus Thermoplasmatota archaeon]MBU4143784.1 ribbon-helix-helix domain-containing protein [Candidatus Thermoplasmatota archaeon]MBU4591382.1 ribbon-helix-helix domain-containing protein [Candidatus Thermoplasmatota archaeon]
MTTDSERVTIRIPKDRLDVLQHMVETGQFPNISDAIRAAIDSFIDTQFTPDHIKKLTLELPKLHHVSLEELVHSGDAISVDEAVRNAVREYVKLRLQKATESQENK